MLFQNSKKTELHIESLFHDYFESLVTYAHKYVACTQTAEDIVQDLFYQMLENNEYFTNVNQQRAYLYKSVTNRCLNHIRDVKVRDEHHSQLLHYNSTQQESIVQQIISVEVNRQLRDIIESLPPRCRQIMELTLEGKKPSEIAIELNLSVETVKKQKKIARPIIKKKIDQSAFLLIAHLF